MASKLAIIFSFIFITFSASAKLNPNFYKDTCPKLLETVKAAVANATANEPRMAASLLRLHFHDCFVNGCDGSILLDDNSTFTGEKTAAPNRNSARGFEAVDKIKAAVESVCPGVVSCADILAITARDSVVQLGGLDDPHTWKVELGRRDSLDASLADANKSIPGPTFNISRLIDSFKQHGLDEKDLVALSGAHTIGQARCTTFRDRIYNGTDIDSKFKKNATLNCPAASGSGDNRLKPLDFQSPTCFDNKYFENLVNEKGLLNSDQQLFSGGSKKTVKSVQTYAKDPNAFIKEFGKSMIKMGNIRPLTGKNGEIRTNCRKTN